MRELHELPSTEMPNSETISDFAYLGYKIQNRHLNIY